ncbi:MAG: preprotein translocase subunit SecE [Planctomycetales bacterium]
MAKSETANGLVNELFSAGIYKRTQGKLARQGTAIAIAAIVIMGAYTLSQTFLSNASQQIRIGVPVAISLIGCWFAFRVVNYIPFAEFLISVEAEMVKVSWASKQELYRSTLVVLGTMFFLAAILMVYDLLWYRILNFLNILRI